MIKKIIVICLVGMFLLTGFTALSAVGKNATAPMETTTTKPCGNNGRICAPFERFNFPEAYIEGTFIPTPYFAKPFIFKLPVSLNINRLFRNINIENFEGTIRSLDGNENTLESNRYNDSKIVKVDLIGKFSILKITKTSTKGMYNVKGNINDLKCKVSENASIPGKLLV